MGAEERAVGRVARRERDALLARLRRDPRDFEARERLAASYREHGQLDQAGRWGMLVSGASSELERRLFAAASSAPAKQRRSASVVFCSSLQWPR